MRPREVAEFSRSCEQFTPRRVHTRRTRAGVQQAGEDKPGRCGKDAVRVLYSSKRPYLTKDFPTTFDGEPRTGTLRRCQFATHLRDAGGLLGRPPRRIRYASDDRAGCILPRTTRNLNTAGGSMARAASLGRNESDAGAMVEAIDSGGAAPSRRSRGRVTKRPRGIGQAGE